MAISSILFLHFIFLGLYNGCLCSNPESVMAQSSEENVEGNGEIQTEDFATNSEVVMVQSQEDNSDKTGKIQIEDLAINSKSVMFQNQESNSEQIYKIQKVVRPTNLESVIEQNQEDINVDTVQMQTKNSSTDPESVAVNNNEYNDEKIDKVQINDFSTNPESEMVDSQTDKIGRYGRIGKLQSEESVQVPRLIAIRFKCPHTYPACNQDEETEAVYQATSDSIPNITPLQMKDFSTNPESVMVLRQVNKNGRIAGTGRIDKIGRIQSEDNQEEESFQIPHFISVRWCPYNDRRCNQGEEKEVHYQKTPDRNPGVTSFPDVWRNTRTYSPYSIRPTQRRTTIRYNIPQMTPINGNDNNNRRNPIPVNTPLTIATEPEEDFKNTNPENAATKPPIRRTRTGAGLFASLVNDFAFKLVENLNLESNFVVSPLSIFVALSMCYLGSDGKTKVQLEQAFGARDYEINGERFHKGINDLLSQVMKDSGGYELFVANGMFLGNNFTANAQFENNIRRYYAAELRNLDFVNPESIRFINGWVAEKTRNMITSIINRPPDILTRLILLNAVFFKGIWKMQFPQRLTYDGKFHLLNGDEKQVHFMRLLDETFPIFRSDRHQHTFIKLPYDGEEVSMIIALPHVKRQKPMPTVTDAILHYDVSEELLNTEIGTIAIPKFKLEYQTTLKRPLQQLGITDIFDASIADLSKIRQEKDLYLSKIVHKAVVDVNEVGTTASAITSDFVGLGYRNKTNFIADHPFAFYIVHEATGLVLFYGKVYDFDSAASDSHNRRGNVPFNPRPMGADDSNDKRENTRNRPPPMQGDDPYNVRDVPSERRGSPPSRPAEVSNSNNRRQNIRPRFPSGPLNDPYNRRQNPGSRYRPEDSGLNDQRESERTEYIPAEDSNSNTRRNNRPPPRPAVGSDFDMYG